MSLPRRNKLSPLTTRASFRFAVTFILALISLQAQATSWQPLPVHGADVRSLVIDPGDSESIFAGTSGGHVYRSEDGGQSWRSAGEAVPFGGWVVGSLIFDPNLENRLWAGLWGIWGSGLVAFSDDHGIRWTLRRNGLPQAAVYALAAVPGAPGKLYAATREGVFGTEDHGLNWRLLSGAYPQLVNVSSLLVDPFEPATVLAGTWRRAYRSDDGGRTWRGIFDGMALDSEVFTLRAVPDRPGEIWASTCGWVYRSPNRGVSWARHSQGLQERRSPSIVVLPDGSLITGTVRGLYRSQDNGENWQLTSSPEIAINTLAVHPSRPNRVLVGTEGAGVWISEDGGRRWSSFPKGMTNLRVDALARLGDEVFAAVNHAGPFSGIYRVASSGEAIREDLSIPTVLDLASHGDDLYAATEQGLYERRVGDWRRVQKVGSGRVEGLTARDSRLVVRTPTQLFERTDGPFRTIPFHSGSPQAIAVQGKTLWVGTNDALFRLGQRSPQPVSMPSAEVSEGPTRLVTAGEELWLTGGGAVWRRSSPEASWQQARGGPARLLETDDRDFPLLVLAREAPSWIYHRPTSSLLDISLPSAPWDIRSALVKDGHLLLATAGHGLQSSPLPEVPREKAEHPDSKNHLHSANSSVSATRR